MDKFEALESIKAAWNNNSLKLGEKIITISNDYHSAGLDLATTAAYIKATPIELEAFLELGELDDELIDRISEINPPRTTWTMLASANEEEIEQALSAISDGKDKSAVETSGYTVSEYVYKKMLEVSGPTIEMKVGNLSGDDLKHALKKGENFNALSDWEKKFLKSVSGQKKRGRMLTDKQVMQVIKILGNLVDKKAILRNSIDGDQDICDRILDALGR